MIGDNFQRKKEDIRSSSIKTRSKAHDTIKRMLASLGDPYTRFLSPDEVIHYLSPLFLSVFSVFFFLSSSFSIVYSQRSIQQILKS